jgi:iron complex outermembrane receptor protein
MHSLDQTLKLSGSTAAMIAAAIFFANTAHAQDQGAATPVEQVEVSASRINIAGYTSSTPETVIDPGTITSNAYVDIGTDLRQLPSVGQSWSPDTDSKSGEGSQGDQDLSTVDLRDLGNIRTLVLFDGQRVVMSNPNSGTPPLSIGGVDLQTLPQAVIQRVEVVTGGASAAWGSDAVAGVVNLVIDKTFTGVKGDFTFGDSYKDDHRQYKAQLFVGTDFLGGRAHVELAGNWVDSPDMVSAYNRGWYYSMAQIVPSASLAAAGINETGAPTWVHLYGANSQSGSPQETAGGLITANPAGTVAGTANILKGTQFVGPNANAVPFNFGAVNGGTCYFCSASPDSTFAGAPDPLAVPYHNLALFNYDSYRLTSNITASIMLNYGQSYALGTSASREGNVTINSGNPFIPASVQSIMTADNIPSFTLGTTNSGSLMPATTTFSNMAGTIGGNVTITQRQLMRGVATLEGAYSILGQDWTWKAYAQNSGVRENEREPYNTIGQDYANATDAVTVTATGPNSLGGGNAALAAQVKAALSAAGAPVPQVGQAACASSLTSTAWGTTTTNGITSVLPGGLTPFCSPLNQFGIGNASEAALNYIAPGRIDAAEEDRGAWYLGQSVVDISTQGELPWGLPAGHVAVATGYSYRLEQQTNYGDPLKIGTSAAYSSGNFSSWSGHYYVNEGFLEVNAPLLKDDVVQSLDFNAAGRMTDYNTSGLVETWKLGLTSQVNDDIRLRGTLSADIRAPDVSELFSAPLFSVSQKTYPNPNSPEYEIYTANSGNPNLTPEEAVTVSGGVVLTPHWIPNLTISADWYSIDIHHAIYALSSTQIFQECGAGVALYCNLVFFGEGFSGNPSVPVAQEVNGNGQPASGFYASRGTFPAAFNGAPNLAFISPLNATSETDDGLDFQADYGMQLWDNPLSWHLVGNYTNSRTLTVLGQTYNTAGIAGGGSYVDPLAGLNEPKVRFTLSATYDQGPYEFTVQTRYVGSWRYSPTYTSGIQIDHNYIAPVAYLDLRGSYQWSPHAQIYFAIDNTMNIPPMIGGTNNGSTGGGGAEVYDEIGRSFRFGVRFDG